MVVENWEAWNFMALSNADRQRTYRERNASVTRNATAVTNSNVLYNKKRNNKREDPPLPPIDSEPEKRTPADSASKLTLRQAEYRKAYEQGIAAGKGQPYSMPNEPWETAALHQAIASHAVYSRDHSENGKRRGEKCRGNDLIVWIGWMAEEFAKSVLRASSKQQSAIGWYSSFSPKGFLKWLNEQSATEEAKSVP